MLEGYFPILLFILVGVVVGVVPVVAGSIASRLVGVHRPDSEKLSPYECGFEAFEDARMKFDALLPGSDPVHPVRPGDRVSFRGPCAGKSASSASSMMVFLGIPWASSTSGKRRVEWE
jgi:hypothetical protein